MDKEKFVIFFNKEEWENHIKNIKQNDRKRLNVAFHNSLAQKIQFDHNIKCFAQNISNYLNKTNPFWKGKYKCADKSCNVIFHAMIEKEPKDQIVPITICMVGTGNHLIICKKLWITKEFRERTALNIMAIGVSNFQNEIICNQDQDQSKFKMLHI